MRHDEEMTYGVQLEDRGERIIFRVLDLPEVLYWAEKDPDASVTQDWLDEHADNAVMGGLQGRMASNNDIPDPHEDRQVDLWVSLTPSVIMKISIYRIMRDKGLTRSALAELLSRDPKIVRRLLDLNYESKESTLIETLETLGFQVSFSAHLEEIEDLAAAAAC